MDNDLAALCEAQRRLIAKLTEINHRQQDRIDNLKATVAGLKEQVANCKIQLELQAEYRRCQEINASAN